MLTEEYTHPSVFDDDVKKIAIRQGYGEGLVEAGRRDKRVVALCADLTESTKTQLFKEEFPDRFFEMGITEQSMASVASGMAAMGRIPFVASYAMFSPGRNWEQIRTTICYNNVNVKIVGAHAGVSVGPDGGTHQAIEDIALTRVLPRMQVVVPCDALEAKKATIAVAETPSPTYLRLQREATPIVTTMESPFKIGKAQIVWRGKCSRVALIACGALVHTALLAAKRLEKKGIHVLVLNNATIKPLDTKTLLGIAREVEQVITIEEHQRAGGMGSAIAEYYSEKNPLPVHRMGIEDVFGQSGMPEELLHHYGLDVEAITQKVEKVLAVR